MPPIKGEKSNIFTLPAYNIIGILINIINYLLSFYPKALIVFSNIQLTEHAGYSLIRYNQQAVRSLMISPAMISPTTDGTKAVDPGISRLWVHFLTVPGGQMQCCLQLIDISSRGLTGFSLE